MEKKVLLVFLLLACSAIAYSYVVYHHRVYRTDNNFNEAEANEELSRLSEERARLDIEADASFTRMQEVTKQANECDEAIHQLNGAQPYADVILTQEWKRLVAEADAWKRDGDYYTEDSLLLYEEQQRILTACQEAGFQCYVR